MTLRDRLREATRDEHRRLETLLALERPGLPLASYQQYLRLSHAFYAALEPRLAGARELAATGLDMARRTKRHWLAADLGYFGLAPAAPAPGARLPSQGHLLGCAYVLEGATLGGQVLQRTLSPRLGIAPGRGATFLEGYGARTGAMWRTFVASLEDAGRNGADEAACIDGARETFVAMGDWFRLHGWR
jgi:heme oxygenase